MPSLNPEVKEKVKPVDVKKFSLPSSIKTSSAIIIVGKDKQVKRYE